MNLSLGELEALCRKAARGAGFDWGTAEEAGRAARRLAAFALPGVELLLVRLDAFDRYPARELSPVALDDDWRSGGEALCPILAGASLADVAGRFGEGDREGGEKSSENGEITLHDVTSPLLLVPFVGIVARRLGRPASVAWSGLVATDDGETVRLDGARERARDERVGRVRCRFDASADPPAGEPLPRVTRAPIDPVLFERLDRYARRTYAPATDESRRRGAGGG